MPRILLVEDDPIIARLATAGLTRASFDVTHASSGREALRRLEAERFDVAVIDLGLPDIEGSLVIRWLRHQETHCGRPPTFVVVSSGSLLTSKEASMMAVDGVLNKPFTVKALLPLLETRRAEVAS
jgi:DNA-binding response OmpR family regulator